MDDNVSMNPQVKKYYNLSNDSYRIFTPDFIESNKLDIYLKENNESILNFLDSYQEQFNSFDKHKSLLELGCGLGGISLEYSSRGLYTLGLDQSDLAIQNAKEISRLKNMYAKFKVFDVCAEEFLGEKFDYIIDSHLMHCLVDELDRNRYLSFVKKHLNLNGLFFLETMSYHSKIQIPFGYELDENNNLLKELNGNFVFYRKIVESVKLEQELVDAGFKIKYLYYHNELSFDVFSDYENYKEEFLPKTIRLVASL